MTKHILIFLFLIFSEVSASEIVVYPKNETEPVFSSGDAADDPAFWYNQKDPLKSVIFGTDKKAGLHSFSLSGKRIQFISSGKINNIDSSKSNLKILFFCAILCDPRRSRHICVPKITGRIT